MAYDDIPARQPWTESFGRMLGPNVSRVSFVGVPRDDVDEETWWQTPDGCATYLMEYCKMPYYWLRY